MKLEQIVWIAVAATISGAGFHVSKEPLFSPLSPTRTGVRFVNEVSDSDKLNVLEYEYLYNGGGVAAGDINNDGLPDLYFSANAGDNKLYLNRGDLRFEDITDRAGVAGGSGWTTGVTMTDVNADGLLDIYVCRSGRGGAPVRRNQLFVNNGDLTFTERAADFGIDDPSYSTQASFFDYDNDGDLDLFLVNHPIKRYTRFDVEWIKKQYDPLSGDKLFRNDDGRFVDVSQRAGIIGNPIGFGLSASVSDINGDGWLDIYVANDYVEDDYLYINQRDGTFSEEVRSWLDHTSFSSMGSDIADINNDGLPDLVVLDMLAADNRRQKLLKGPESWAYYEQMRGYGYHHQFMWNMLHLNEGTGSFMEVGRLAGISATDWSWSALLADYDNDGLKDLFVTNGYLRDYTDLDFLKTAAPAFFEKQEASRGKTSLYDLVQHMPQTPVRNYLFRNEGDLKFRDQTEAWGLNQVSISNGAAYADLDDDGDLDLIVNNINQQAFIYRNNAAGMSRKTYLKVSLAGPPGNRHGIGARVTLTTADGQRFQQELMPSRGYQSSVDPVLVFGTGNASRVDVRVEWPGGRVTVLRDVPTNGRIGVSHEEPASVVPEEPVRSKPGFLFLEGALGVDYVHEEDSFSDFTREPLLPHMYSRLGPAAAVGDANGDGLDDIFLGGALDQAASLYLQQAAGTFMRSDQPSFTDHSFYEDVNAVFFDADGDRDADLYVVSGGSHDVEGSSAYLDRLYVNDGFGGFTYDPLRLPGVFSSGSAVAPHDFDRDGDVDLFVGGRIIPGGYPLSPRSYLLENRDGRFSDVTAAIAPDLVAPGLVTDALWADLDGDRVSELVVVGEWMPVRVFEVSETSLLRERSASAGLSTTEGWWNCIAAGDLDGDGDIDLVAGNVGLNTYVQARTEEPVRIYAADFDGSGSIDPILTHYISHESVPLAARDDLLSQLPGLAERFPDYRSYAETSAAKLLSGEDMSASVQLEASVFESSIFENLGSGIFRRSALPTMAQVSPVNGIIAVDFDGDGFEDLLVAGNNYAVNVQEGRHDAGRGLLLEGRGDLTFEQRIARHSGFVAPWDVRRLALIQTRRGSVVMVVNNNAGVAMFAVLRY